VRTGWIAVAVCATAASLSAWLGLSAALTSDDVWSLRTVALPWASMMEALRADVHPPFYFGLLWGWVRVFGPGETSVRILSSVLYLLSGAAVFGAARSIFGRPAAALACAIVFVASPLAVLTSRLVRMYSLLTLLATVSMWLFFVLARRPSPRTMAAYAAINAAGTLTHAWFFFLLLGQAAAYLYGWGLKRIWWWVGAAAFSLGPFAILWLPVMMAQLGKSGQTLAWVPAPTLGNLAETLLLNLGFALLVVPLVWWGRRQESMPREVAVCLTVALVAVLVPFAISFWKPVFWGRFTAVALPAVALAAGAVLATKGRQAEIALALMACGLQLGLAANGQPCNSRWGAEWLARNTRPADVVIFTNLSRPPLDYYWDRLQKDRRVTEFSFPRQVDAHPGYVGQYARHELEAEADNIVWDARNRLAGTRIFVLHGGFLPDQDAILLQRLEGSMKRIPRMCHECAGLGTYFDRISVFEKR